MCFASLAGIGGILPPIYKEVAAFTDGKWVMERILRAGTGLGGSPS